MSVLAPEDHSSLQWAWIVSTLQSEMTAGKRIASIKAVEPSLSLWTDFAPAVGVQLMDMREEGYSTSQHKLWSDFIIQVSAQSTKETALANGYSIPNLSDAMLQLKALISDGTGNGVCSILRDPANRTLGGYAAQSTIKGIHYQPEIQMGATAGDEPVIWAHAFIDFTALQFVAIQ
jgi:hypothetical protein